MKKLKVLFVTLCALASVGAWAKTDVTNTYLTNAGLSSLSGWTILDGFYTDWQPGGDVPVIEFYHTWGANAGAAIGNAKTFDFSQSPMLPAGYYRLCVNAFYREGNGNGTNTKAYIYAGDTQQNVVGLSAAGVGSYTGGSDLFKAANAFSRGDFSNEFDFQVTEAGPIQIGFHGYIDTYCSWCILGPVTLYEYTKEDYMGDYDALVSQAEALYSTPMNAAVLTALKAAAGKKSSLVTVDDVKNACAALKTAVNNANASIAEYGKINEAINLLDSDGKTALASAIAKYNNGEWADYSDFMVNSGYVAALETPYEGATVAAGTFYLYNIQSGKFMNGGNDWGTQISLADAGQPMILAKSGDNYTIDSQISNGGDSHYVGTGGYLDGTAAGLTFTNIGNNVYTISWDGGTKMYGYDGSSTIVATQTDMSAGSYWQLVTAEQICAAAVENGTEAAPFDVTSLIKDNNFGRNNTLFIAAWQGSPAKGGANDNMNAEKFNTTFDVYQTLSGLPNGKYIVKAQAFYRAGGGGTTDTAANAVLYANNDSVAIENINAEASATSGNGFTRQADSKFVPDSQADASAVFSAGKYDNNEVEAIVTDGTLKIGFWKEKAVGNDWTIFDNVRLYYCGPVLAKGTVKMTYVDYDDPDTAAGEVTEAVAGYNKISGGTVAAAKAEWGVTKIIYLQVDITDVAITNGKVTLSAECSGSTDGMRVTTWGVGYNTSTWSENLTYDTADKRITLCGETVTTTTKAKDTYETLSWDITDAFAGGNKVATILVYETAAGGGNFKNPTVAVEEGANMTITDVKWGTFVAPFDVTIPEGVEAYTCDAVEGDVITTTEVKTTIPANTPVLVYSEEAVNTTFYGKAVSGTPEYGIMVGTYEDVQPEVGCYLLQKNADNTVTFNQIVSGGAAPWVRANRCYLSVSSSTTMLRFGGATGIQSMEQQGESVIYDLTGRRVDAAAKGIYIVNGKKMLVK